MAVTVEHLQAASDVIGAATTLRDAATLWRARFPDVRAVVVDALDMREETPALLLGRRKVFLAASNGHCWHVTQQPEDASALILTQE
jgi:hypothetical protein